MSTPVAAVSAATTASGLAAIRDVGRAGFRVIGASPRRPAFDAHSRWSLRYLELPPPRDAAMLLDVLAQAKVEVMLPMESSYVGASFLCGRPCLRLRDFSARTIIAGRSSFAGDSRSPHRACSAPRNAKIRWW
jgi:hypothetical protein